LTGGSRTALPRQQTLRAAIEWSHALLGERERALLRRLSIFAGGCTLEAAETVCAGHAAVAWSGVPADEVLDLLAQLANKSLLTVTEQGGQTRYSLLETLRAYGRDKLAAYDEVARAARRHGAWCLALATEAEAARSGPAQGGWLERLETEHDNLRAALAWGLAGEAVGMEMETEPDAITPDVGLRLAVLLRWFWDVRGHLSEGRRWLERALTVHSAADPLWRAQALTGAGRLAERQGDYTQARRLYEESLTLWRALEDRRGIANSLIGLGVVASCQGDLAGATAIFAESLALDRALGYQPGMTISLNNLGGVAYYQGDYERARALFAESLAIGREIGDTRTIAMALNNLGDVAQQQGQHQEAMERLEQALAAYRSLGDKGGIALTTHSLGVIASLRGEYGSALAYLGQSLRLRREMGDKPGCIEGLEDIAAVDVAQGRVERAARLLGTAEAAREVVGVALLPANRPAYERAMAALRQRLDARRHDALWAKGRAMTLDDAIAAALNEIVPQ
jgi:tetratricopeptide (TPR) repeat protein